MTRATGTPAFDATRLGLLAGGMRLSGLVPLLDGTPLRCDSPRIATRPGGWTVSWQVLDEPRASFILEVESSAGALRLSASLSGIAPTQPIDSLGLRVSAAEGVSRYLRNGYTSWDGSYFVEIDAARGVLDEVAAATVGYAMTALVGAAGATAVVGFLRHDRYQTHIQFGYGSRDATSVSIDFETLLDRVPHQGTVAAESLGVWEGSEVEATLRQWAHAVADASPQSPRLRAARICGWCSWYNLYSSIDESVLLEHLRAAVRFRDPFQVPFEVFQIDDGFVPEMGDWLDTKPQFPRGMQPLLADIRAAGFTPGLWIAPFMVGNRSRLYAQHPDWVVLDRDTSHPIAPMKFYGEFRWHKRSEEYYILDVTHPEAEAHIRNVFRTWAREWGCGYFKTDFMYFGAEYGPARARWHTPGLSRMEVWMRMVRLIREEINDALWLGCGGPIWAPVGWMDAVRIGRDIGVSWKGHYSAESLLRDQTSRNFANGILWQADPDCILLRDRFHDLTDTEVRSLATFAALSGGVLMTSDQLDDVPPARRALFAGFARDSQARTCDFPLLGQTPLRHSAGVGHTGVPVVVSEGDPVLVQRVRLDDGSVRLNVFNTGDEAAQRTIPWSVAGCSSDAVITSTDPGPSPTAHDSGIRVTIQPHASRLLKINP